jgi:dienelactone hydrolase
MARAFAEDGQPGRNRAQLKLLETDELDEALAGLSFLRRLPEVNMRRMVVAGHSFGGSLTLLMVARDTTLRAAVVFGGAATSWGESPSLRTRLREAIRRTRASVLFIHAANDYSIAPGEALAEEMRRLRKPHGLKIYPPNGRNSHEGHNLLYRRVDTWESDVFASWTTTCRKRIQVHPDPR